MIPKVLVYGNFGHFKYRNEIEVPCMKSWEKYFPKSEWTWIELNETTFDVNKFYYTKLAYSKGFFSFVNDFARVWYLATHGGVYVDTDLLMFKKLDEAFLTEDMFIGSCIYRPYQNTNDFTSWGIVGCSAGNKFMTQLLENFKAHMPTDLCSKEMFVMTETRRLLEELEQIKRKAICESIDKPLKAKDLTVYPFDYFTCTFWNTDFVKITDNSYSMHLYGSSWQTKTLKSKAFKRLTSTEMEKYLCTSSKEKQ